MAIPFLWWNKWRKLCPCFGGFVLSLLFQHQVCAIYDFTPPYTTHSMCNAQLRSDYGLQFYGKKPEEWLRYTTRVNKYKHGNALTEEELFSVIPTLHFFSCQHVCSTDLQKYTFPPDCTTPVSKIHIPLISFVKALNYSGKYYSLLPKVAFV